MKAKAVDRFSPDVLPPLTHMLITHAKENRHEILHEESEDEPEHESALHFLGDLLPLGMSLHPWQFQQKEGERQPQDEDGQVDHGVLKIQHGQARVEAKICEHFIVVGVSCLGWVQTKQEGCQVSLREVIER
jgi:hypothetical protein